MIQKRVSETALRERVTWLGAALKGMPAVNDVAHAVLDGMALALDRTPAKRPLDAEDLARAEALLREEIGTEAFVMGKATLAVAAS